MSTEEDEDTVSIISFSSSASSTPPLSPPPTPPASEPSTPVPKRSAEDRRQALTCSLCLDIYRNPKLLPCSHTFCQQCLAKLLAHYVTPAFPCPYCRRGIAVPGGGVAGFQTNFYIHPEDLVKARDGTVCLSHPEQELDMFCKECQMPVCLKCKLTCHEDHKIQELSDAFREARTQLKEDKERLEESLASMIQQVEFAKKEQQAQHDKRLAMESIIRKQHGTLVAAAEKFLVEALATLKTASEGVETSLHKQVLSKKSDLDDLCQLQDELNQTLTTENRYKLLAAVKEMREGRGSPQALGSIIASSQKEIRSEVQPDFILSHLRQFLSTVAAVESELKACSELTIQNGVNMKHIKVSVSVEKQFKCGRNYETEVFSVCPLDDGNIWVSYIKNGAKENPPSEKYNSQGKLLCSNEKIVGKASLKSIGKGKVRHLLPIDGGLRLFCKWGNEVLYRISNSVNGRATITKLRVLKEEPFNALLSDEFTINVGPHRGFDVDAAEELFVVLEEPLPPETQRKMRMFKRKEENPVATYSPPTPTFQPSDVCFCRLGGDGAVLVADELGDSIHVLSLDDGVMSFIRYLAPGSPSLLQPTALNVDVQGRLWVACRGGQLLTMFPVT